MVAIASRFTSRLSVVLMNVIIQLLFSRFHKFYKFKRVAYDGIANLQKSYTENLIFFFCAKIMYPCPVPPIWLLLFKGGVLKKDFFTQSSPLRRSPSDRSILFDVPLRYPCPWSHCSPSVRLPVKR